MTDGTPNDRDPSESPDGSDAQNEPNAAGSSDGGGIDGSETSGTGDPVGTEAPIGSGRDSDPDPTDERDTEFPALRKRLAVGIGIVIAVLVLAAIAGAVAPPAAPTQSVENAPDPEEPPAPFTEDVRPDRIEAEGEVTVSEDLTVGGGYDRQTILIEETGSFEQPDIRPLVAAATMAGHEVRIRNSADLDSALNGDDTDAYVLVAPRQGFSEEEIDAITEFTDDGGRLILLASPDRITVSSDGLIGSLQTTRTDMRMVANEYGIVFGNRYLYDTANSDATYRQVFAQPTEAARSDANLGFDRAVLPTATRVESSGGTVLLRTPETTTLSDGGTADTYPVAVADGNVLAVGNTRFLSETNHNVADNEDFVTYLVEFALGGR